MPVQLLPASAAAFAPRASSVNVVLGSKVEPWLTQTLKRINRVKRPLNSVPQHQRCLTETLSSPNAIWTLASIMLPKLPEADLHQDSNPLVEALFNHQLLHIEAYIVHVDMVLCNEVAFKLTAGSIDALVDYHKDIHCIDTKASTHDWSEKDQQCKKLHDDFVQAVNKFVYHTHVSALEGLEEEGAGELLSGKSEEVKNSIMALMKPLLPPPPRVVDLVRQPSLMPSPSANPSMWPQAPAPVHLPAMDAWRVLTSSPRIASTSQESTPLWSSIGMSDVPISSPSSSFNQPLSTTGFYYTAPPVAPSIPALPLPSMFTPQCGVAVGYGAFGWDRHQEFATTTTT